MLVAVVCVLNVLAWVWTVVLAVWAFQVGVQYTWLVRRIENGEYDHIFKSGPAKLAATIYIFKDSEASLSLLEDVICGYEVDFS